MLETRSRRYSSLAYLQTTARS